MRILVTNDDGYLAPGIEALTRIAGEWGQVRVMAPSEEQSYAGHRVTVGGVLRPVEYAPGRFHLNGTPADCVRVAVEALRWEVDLVLAGINRGGNLGADIYTSGTVAAAREGAYLGRRAVALSQYVNGDNPLDWARTGEVAERALRGLMDEVRGEDGVYWNVNLPHPEPECGLRRCEPDVHPLDVRYEAVEGGYRYAGRYRDRRRTSGRDVDTCFAGYVTVSRLRL